MCKQNTIGKILNPIGAIAPKGTIGKILDPVGAIGESVGGPTGMLIDPAGALRDPDAFDKTPPPPEPKKKVKDPGRTASDSAGPNKSRSVSALKINSGVVKGSAGLNVVT